MEKLNQGLAASMATADVGRQQALGHMVWRTRPDHPALKAGDTGL